MTNDISVLDAILATTEARHSYDSMADWFKNFNLKTRQFESSVDRAILGGRLSQNLSFAFASGYQSAVESLFSNNEPDYLLSSLCVSEDKGNRPRHMETTLVETDGLKVLNGSKKFVSGASDSQLMYVACKVGSDQDGRAILKVVSLASDTPGVTITPLPTLPFIPGVSHGKVSFDQVEISQVQVLSGDGYAKYIRPFRTYEDLHVLAAVLGFRIGQAIDSSWGEEAVQAHLSLVLSLQALNQCSLTSATSHIGLASCRDELNRLIDMYDAKFEANDVSGFEAWKRDRMILNVAKGAHEKRTSSAWDQIVTYKP